MPRIQINEIDLTTASYQLSSNDIVFVPGLSSNKDAIEGLSFCESVADFEEKFGTTPAVISLANGIKSNFKNAKKVKVKFINTTGEATYRKFCDDNRLGYGNTFVCVTGNEPNTSQDSSMWQTGKYSKSLTDLGLTVDTTDKDFKEVEWTAPEFNFGDDLFTIKAKSSTAAYDPTRTYFTKGANGVYYVWTPESSDDPEFEEGETYYVDDPRDSTSKPKDWSTKFYKYFNYDNVDTIARPCSMPEFKTGFYYTDESLDSELDTVPDAWGYPGAEYYDCTSDPKVDFVVGDTITINPEYDLSYVYAKELLLMGLPVMYYCIKADSYEDLDWTDVFNYGSPEGIMDKGEYSIKYLTSGAIPSFVYHYNVVSNEYDNAGSFYSAMLQVAANRGDCVAIIDGEDDACGALPTVFTNAEGVPYSLNNLEEIASIVDSSTYLNAGSLWAAAKYFFGNADHTEYGTMFTPWATYTTSASYYTKFPDGTKTLTNGLSTVLMPPSFAYLKALARSIRTNASWIAIAGVNRGVVPAIKDLHTSKLLSNTVANEMQPRNGETSINAITNIKPYGLTIWGNRTLKNNLITAQGGEDGLVATSFLNIRNLVSDVKKVVYNAAKILMFEQNTQILWINFMSKITPELDRMVSGQGLSSYKVIQVPTKEKAKLQAVIKIYPLYAVEDFEISIEIRDDDTVVVS